MNYEVIERLIKLIDASGLRELELEEAGLKIRMSKNDSSKVIYSDENKVINKPIEVKSNASKPINQDNKSNSINTREDIKVENLTSIENELDGCYLVKSPMVGTYYSSPTESGEPYVKVGDVVSKNSVLCIIEAMKLMNEIDCEVDGTVTKIFVNNGDVVEFGQPMMAISI